MSNQIKRTGAGKTKRPTKTQPKGMKGRRVAGSQSQATEPRVKAKDAQSQPASVAAKPKKVVVGSVSVAEKSAVTSTPKQLEVALTLAIQHMKNYDPSFTVSPEQFEAKLAELVASTTEVQQDFIDKFLKPALQEYNYYNDPAGWGPWLKTGMDIARVVTAQPLMDRAVKFYKEGSESVSMMLSLSSWLADITTFQARERAYNIGAGILGVTEQIAAAGTVMVNAISSAVETVYDTAEAAHPEFAAEKSSPGLFSKESMKNVVETAVEFAHPHRLDEPEAVAEEAKQTAEALVGLSSKEIIKDGAEVVLDTYLDFTTKHAADVISRNTPVAIVLDLLKEYSGNVGNAIAKLIKGGNWAALEVLMTVALMDEFGVAVAPKTMGLQGVATAPNVANPYFSRTAMICVFVNIAVTTIMKIIQNGQNPSAQQTVVAFLTKGPLSVKTMGIKGSVDALLKSFFKAVNPYLSLALTGFLTVAADSAVGVVKRQVKKVVKATLDTTEKKLNQGADLVDTLGGLGPEQEIQKKPQAQPRGVGPRGAKKIRKSGSSRK